MASYYRLMSLFIFGSDRVHTQTHLVRSPVYMLMMDLAIINGTQRYSHEFDETF